MNENSDDVRTLANATLGEILPHARILAIMATCQHGGKRDDHGNILPEDSKEEFRYTATIGRWNVDYEGQSDKDNPMWKIRLTLTYGPHEYVLFLDREHRVERTLKQVSSFEIAQPSDLELVKEFADEIVGAVITVDTVSVYCNETAYREAAVSLFGNDGDITHMNALYYHFGKDLAGEGNPYFFKGWMAWGNIVWIKGADASGADEQFGWVPHRSMNTALFEQDREYIQEAFGEVPDDEVLRIKHDYIMKDEATVRENFRRRGISVGHIL